jgi:hypothetical protein
MSLRHARPKLTHMPHQIEARRQAEADRIRARSAAREPEHLCEVCGKVGSFGFNYFRHAPELGVFACFEHRADVEAALG